MYHSVDRGAELGRLRAEKELTDVILVSGAEEIHAHKLILSLHSHYFRNERFKVHSAQACRNPWNDETKNSIWIGHLQAILVVR